MQASSLDFYSLWTNMVAYWLHRCWDHIFLFYIFSTPLVNISIERSRDLVQTVNTGPDPAYRQLAWSGCPWQVVEQGMTDQPHNLAGCDGSQSTCSTDAEIDQKELQCRNTGTCPFRTLRSPLTHRVHTGVSILHVQSRYCSTIIE